MQKGPAEKELAIDNRTRQSDVVAEYLCASAFWAPIPCTVTMVGMRGTARRSAQPPRIHARTIDCLCVAAPGACTTTRIVCLALRAR